MLFKRRTAIARRAQFVHEPKPILEADNASGTPEPATPPPPTPEEREIARLTDERDALREDLRMLRAGWDEALAESHAMARATAAAQHIADDEDRLAELRKGLAEALSTFEATLQTGAEPLARVLAEEALGRLVAPLTEEREWLARSIGRRLGEMRKEAVVGLQISPDGLEEAQLAELRASTLPGTAIVFDSGLKLGTARIVLRLGRAEIDPERGLKQMLELIGDGDA